MVVELRYEDFEGAVVNSRTADPVALAAQRAGLRNPRVGRKTISWEEGETRKWAPLPDNIVRLLKRLTYEAKEEILPALFNRNKKTGDVTGTIKHKPIAFLLGNGEVQVG